MNIGTAEPRPDVCLIHGANGVTWQLHSYKYPGAPVGVLPRSRKGAIKAATKALRKYRKRWPNLGSAHGRPTKPEPTHPNQLNCSGRGQSYEWVFLPEGLDDSARSMTVA